jgi:hypothetical protein
MSDSEEVIELKAEIFSLLKAVKDLNAELKDSEDELLGWIHRHAEVVERKDDELKEKEEVILDYERKLYGSFFKRAKSAVLLLIGKI